MREGDVLIVWKLDRLGRSLSHLIRIVEDLKIRGVAFKSLTEAIDTTTPHGSFLFNLFGTLAEYERTLITERVNAGRAAARRLSYRELIRDLDPSSITALEQLLAERAGERSLLGWIAEAPEGVKLKNLRGLIARLEVLRVVSGKPPKFCGLLFLVVFRNLNNTISNPLRQSFHPFCKSVIPRILQADVVHLDF